MTGFRNAQLKQAKQIFLTLKNIKICLLTPLYYYMHILYHILGRHAILMLCLNLMLGPTYLP